MTFNFEESYVKQDEDYPFGFTSNPGVLCLILVIKMLYDLPLLLDTYNEIGFCWSNWHLNVELCEFPFFSANENKHSLMSY